MKAYHDIVKDVIETGTPKHSRAGATRYKFSQLFRHDMSTGFPLLTTKKVNLSNVVGELFGFLRGFDNTKQFEEFGCKIWNPWGLEEDVYQIVETKFDELHDILVSEKGLNTDEVTSLLNDLEDKIEMRASHAAYLTDVITNSEDHQVQQEAGVELSMLQSNDPYVQFLSEHEIPRFERKVIYPAGYLGPIYGKVWSEWKTSTGVYINQIKTMAHQLQLTPNSRRIVLTGWNPELVPADSYKYCPITKRGVIDSKTANEAAIEDGKQVLPPCHLLTVLSLDPEGAKLNLSLTMRSTDLMVGLPYNIAFYAVFLLMVCKEHGFNPGELTIHMVDCHVYEDQVELAKGQLQRDEFPLPTLTIPDGIVYDQPETLSLENLKLLVDSLENYQHHPHIPYPVAV